METVEGGGAGAITDPALQALHESAARSRIESPRSGGQGED
jgi:hypothetical protein